MSFARFHFFVESAPTIARAESAVVAVRSVGVVPVPGLTESAVSAWGRSTEGIRGIATIWGPLESGPRLESAIVNEANKFKAPDMKWRLEKHTCYHDTGGGTCSSPTVVSSWP